QFYHGLTLAGRGEPREGMELMQVGLSGSERISFNVLRPMHLSHLALAHASVGDSERALTVMAQALHTTGHADGPLYEAQLPRLRGELLTQTGDNDAAAAEFDWALAIARRQQAKMWELRAATSLARLWRGQGRRADALELLAPVYGWFTEGFGMLDLKEAKD